MRKLRVLALVTPLNRLTLTRLLAVFVLLLVLRTLLGSTYRAATTSTGIYGVDFEPTYAAATRLNQGVPLYSEEPDAKSTGRLLCQFPSSPFVPMLVRPLAHLPLADATRTWVAVNVILLALSAFLFCWGSRIHLLDSTLAVLLVIFTGFRFWPTTIEVAIANNDILLLASVCGMIVCHRFGRWWLLALLIALAALVKTWMLGMIFPLLVARRWREAGGAVGFFIAGLAVLFSIARWEMFPIFVAITRLYSSQPLLVSNSVAGMAGMFFAENHHMTPWFPHVGAWLAAMILGYGTLLGGLWMMWVRGPRMTVQQRQLGLALSALALVLGSPVSHLLYFVLTLPVIWTLLCVPWGGAHRLIAPAFAFVVYFILSVPSPCLTPLPESCRTGLRSVLVTMTFLPSFLLWIYGVALACRREAEQVCPSSRPAAQAELLCT